MKRNERVFLVAVAVMAVVFSVLSFGNARQRFLDRDAGSIEPGVAGQPRDVDVDQIKRMIRQGYLSDHEAQFYAPALPEVATGSLPQRSP